MTGEGQGAGHAVFVSQRFPPEQGGNASRVHDTVTNLTDHGWEVTVLAPPPCYPPGEFERSWRAHRTETVDGVTVHRLWTWQPKAEDPGLATRLPYFLVFGVLASLWLLRHVREYDLLVTTTPPISTGLPGLVLSALGVPWVVDVRDLWIDNSVALGYIDEGSWIERLSRRFQRSVLHQADRICVTTATLGEAVADAYGASLSAKTVVVPNGVDLAQFAPQSDGSDPIVIYTGNLGHAQALDAVVAAMAHLSHEEVVLRLVGAGNARSDLERIARERGVGDRVEFAGLVPRERVPALLDDAMLGVAPIEASDELAYAMPTKVYEYLACELATVVTGRGEIERFADESAGAVHAETDPERIAARLDALVADAERRTRLARNGREHVESNYGRAAIAERLHEELTTLLAAR